MRLFPFRAGLLPASLVAALALPALAQKPVAQKNDEEYTKLIKQHLQDARITTELVDHLPASDTVPSPLKHFGHIIGQPGEIEYTKDMYAYFQALAKASPRAKFWTIGKSEEGRDMVMLAIADEATLKALDTHKANLAALTDPRKTTEAQAQQIIKTGKPIYWLTSGMHSPETGGPQMLMELAYRLIVQETPFIQEIRNNTITFITPVIEPDGRDKHVDTYYYGKKTGKQRPPLMYWGKYVAHDNNRDGMGQFLNLTRAVTKTQLEWHPIVMHDLHEAQSYLYSSTGTGPYNEALDPITIGEWWDLANNDVMELTKRGVPGVFTYGFYDGWVPNYMFFIAHSHNAIGRFYEVQSYGPDNNENLRLPATTTSREWFRPNPPLPSIKWGPRNNTNIQQSGVLFSLSHFAKNRQKYMENYWLKNKRSVEKGKSGPINAWVIPVAQRRRGEVADSVNELLRQGLEIHRASVAAKFGNVSVEAGDFIVRADQPYRTLADMYFSIQNYPPQNPRPYDDTGWTFQYMRNIDMKTVGDKAILAAAMTPVTGPVKAPGGIEGAGKTLVVEHTSDNAFVSFRFKNAAVAMEAAEDDFELSGRQIRAGAIIVKDFDRAKLEPSIKDLGLSAWAVDTLPTVKTHALDIPRIGYVHSWQRTQDEGWVRAALDTFGVPYTYFADQKLRDGNLRGKYDVIIFPHIGGTAQSQVNGIPKTGADAVPYKKSDLTPNLGTLDQSDDIRGGMGIEGLTELVKFVNEGGTLITEGSTAVIFPEYGMTSGVTVERPTQLFVRGSVMRGKWGDRKSPIAYGYDASDLPVYFNQDPVLNAGGGGGIPAEFAGFLGGGGPPNAGLGQIVTPMATPLRINPLDPVEAPAGGERPQVDEVAAFRGLAAAFGVNLDAGARPRVVLTFPTNPNDMLLSGSLANGQFLSNRAGVVDAPLGKGHVVMFAIRPFWRWQTQGTFSLGFNAIMNWNDLDAGKPTGPPAVGAGRRPGENHQ
jgi:hypothetical protein